MPSNTSLPGGTPQGHKLTAFTGATKVGFMSAVGSSTYPRGAGDSTSVRHTTNTGSVEVHGQLCPVPNLAKAPRRLSSASPGANRRPPQSQPPRPPPLLRWLGHLSQRWSFQPPSDISLVRHPVPSDLDRPRSSPPPTNIPAISTDLVTKLDSPPPPAQGAGIQRPLPSRTKVAHFVRLSTMAAPTLNFITFNQDHSCLAVGKCRQKPST